VSESDARPRPQYGEYATPEEQRARIRQPDATDALSAGVAPETTLDVAPAAPVQAPPVARRDRRADRIITIALLAYGLFTVVTTLPQLIDFTSFAEQWMSMAGIDATFSNAAQGRLWGSIAAVVFVVGWLATALLSWLSMRRGRLSWWIPLVGAVGTFLLASICLAIPLVTDPAIVSQLGRVG
jgi:hypothetical protein